MFNAKDIALRGTIQEIVKVYQTQTQRIREAYAALKDAGELLTLALGKDSPYSGIDTLPRGSRSYNDSAVKEVLTDIRQSVWRRLIGQLGIKKVLSESRSNELDQKLSDKENLPEITVENIYQMFELLLENANQFAKEAIVEVYNRLHVNPQHYGGHYKTNQRNAFEDLGKKVILGWTIETSYSREHPYRIRYREDNFLLSVDKVFHNLDGAPFNSAGYKSPLIDAINTSPDGKGETNYFKFACYGNGNLHLEFKRADLLKEFNRIANDGTALKSGFHF